MKINKSQQEAVSLFETFVGQLVTMLPTRTQPFFISLLLGALLAIARRRTVTQWLRAAQISDDYRQTFYHIPNIGRKGDELFNANVEIVLEQLGPDIIASSKIRIVLDDSPTSGFAASRFLTPIIKRRYNPNNRFDRSLFTPVSSGQ